MPSMPSMEQFSHIGKGARKTAFLLLLAMPLALSHAQNINDEVRALIGEGRTEEARTRLFDMNRGNVQPDMRLFILGFLSVRGDSARAYYEALVNGYPSSHFADFALFRLAELAYAQGLYRQAQVQFQGVLTHYPQSNLCQKSEYWIGLSYQAMERGDSAAVHFRRAKEGYPASEISLMAQESLDALTRQESGGEKKPADQVSYYVQVGAFESQDNAVLRKSFFESKGYQVFFRKKTRESTVLYLVWLGAFKTADEARAFGEKLKKKYDVNYTLVSER